MGKSEVVVLFDLMGASSIPVGIKDLAEVDLLEYQHIINSFFEDKLIDRNSKSFRPDRGLERFLLPIVKAKAIMIFNYGIGSVCTFNASLYFAESGLVALLDNKDETVKFLTLDSIDELLLFIPDISMVDNVSNDGVEQYISYIMLNKESSIVHCTRLDFEKGIARIAEGKRSRDAIPLEAVYKTEIIEYRNMLYDKLREVYNAVGC